MTDEIDYMIQFIKKVAYLYPDGPRGLNDGAIYHPGDEALESVIKSNTGYTADYYWERGELIYLNGPKRNKKPEKKDKTKAAPKAAPKAAATTPPTKKLKNSIKEIKEANDRFKHPEILNYILTELKKDHIGDEKELMIVFLTMISSRLPPRYRISTGLIGDSSEGKTNVINVCKHQLPKTWYLQFDRITGACIEDDIAECDLLIWKEINEKGLMEKNIDYIKALTEDGLDVMKKTLNTSKEGDQWLPNKISIERKAGVHSSTETTYNEEYANRHLPVSITGDPVKYKKVNESTKKITSDPREEIKALERAKNETWISKGLENLKEYDVISIPDIDLINVRTDHPRTMRDFKRFNNLVKCITWINQLQRKSEEIDGKKVLYSTIIDIYNAVITSEHVFNQAYVSLDKRDENTLNTIKKLVDEKGMFYDETTVGKDFAGVRWIERLEIQNKLKMSLSGVKKRITSLKNAGMLMQINPRKGNLCLLSPYLSLAYHLPITFSFMLDSEQILLDEMRNRQKTGKKHLSDTLRDTLNNNIIRYKDALGVTQNKIYKGNTQKNDTDPSVFSKKVTPSILEMK